MNNSIITTKTEVANTYGSTSTLLVLSVAGKISPEAKALVKNINKLAKKFVAIDYKCQVAKMKVSAADSHMRENGIRLLTDRYQRASFACEKLCSEFLEIKTKIKELSTQLASITA